MIVSRAAFEKDYNRPEWLKKREVILKRDNHKCSICGSMNELNVHHSFYKFGLHAWEYPDMTLYTLCRSCHKQIHSVRSMFINDSLALSILHDVNAFQEDLNRLQKEAHEDYEAYMREGAEIETFEIDSETIKGFVRKNLIKEIDASLDEYFQSEDIEFNPPLVEKIIIKKLLGKLEDDIEVV